MRKPRFLQGGAIVMMCAVLAAAKISAQQWTPTVLHSFGNPELSANLPSSGVMVGSDRKVYGTAYLGGPGGAGVVFRLNRDGSGFEVIHSFTNRLYSFPIVGPPEPGIPSGAEGITPLAGVLEASDGLLYGSTIYGGTNGAGTLYRLTRDGSGFQVIYNFEPTENPPDPYGELIEGRDGMLYGTLRTGGALAEGAIFRINKDGSGYELLHEFDINSDGGGFPECPLVQGNDGRLYGTINTDRDTAPGKIFALRTDGSGFEIIHNFAAGADDGGTLLWGLTVGRDGSLYGVTSFAGPGQSGTVFKLRSDGAGYRILHNFGAEPGSPLTPVREGANGVLYGGTFGGRNGGTLYAIDEDGQSFRVVDTFGRGLRDAGYPLGALAWDGAGNVFGTTQSGGLGGGGTVFRHSIGGGHAVLHSFSSSGWDAALPDSPLCSFSGNTNLFFGITAAGGLYGRGTLFQINRDGTGYKLLRNFVDTPNGLALDQVRSNLYVVTAGFGGKRDGALYRVKPNGNLKLLHQFGGVHKHGPGFGLSFAAAPPLYVIDDGVLYGIKLTHDSGENGTLFRIGVDGKGYQVLHQFDGSNGVPQPCLIKGSDGALYGTIGDVEWPSPTKPGSAFKINRDGTGFTILHTFHFGDIGGPNPAGPLLEASNGILYGTTTYSYASNTNSMIYQMNKDGSGFAVVYSFTYFNGSMTGLVEGADGKLYGGQDGSVFRVNKDGTGFEVIEGPWFFAGNPMLTQPFLSDMQLGVTTRSGGDMNLGQALILSPP